VGKKAQAIMPLARYGSAGLPKSLEFLKKARA